MPFSILMLNNNFLNAHFQTDDIDGQLKRAIVTEFSDALGELKIPALDLAAQYKEIGDTIRGKISERVRSGKAAVLLAVITR